MSADQDKNIIVEHYRFLRCLLCIDVVASIEYVTGLNIVEARLSATSSRVFYHGLPSISFTHTYLVRNNLFGIVKSVSMSDLIMDVQARNVMLALDGDREKTKLYAQQNGVMGSYYEGHIWKQMFPDDPGINPVSTVHLFAQAAIQGQPFVVIDRSNMNEALANITGLGEDTRADIVNSVLAGNTVTTHSMPINMGNWRGFGYVVFNPQTFSSVYMIDGGPRGGCTGCGDGGDDSQAYNSFIDTARFAGACASLKNLFIAVFVALVFLLLSVLFPLPLIAIALALIQFVMDGTLASLNDKLTDEEKYCLVFLLFLATLFVFVPVIGTVMMLLFSLIFAVSLYRMTAYIIKSLIIRIASYIEPYYHVRNMPIVELNWIKVNLA